MLNFFSGALSHLLTEYWENVAAEPGTLVIIFVLVLVSLHIWRAGETDHSNICTSNYLRLTSIFYQGLFPFPHGLGRSHRDSKPCELEGFGEQVQKDVRCLSTGGCLTLTCVQQALLHRDGLLEVATMEVAVLRSIVLVT